MQIAVLTVTIPLRTGQWEERTIPEMFLLDLLGTSLCPKLETTARRLTLSMTVAIL